MIKSAYIHIPFCKTICSYCDFCKFFYNKEWINKYLDSLNYEIDTIYKNEYLDTIYVGGGTPNSLSDDELIKLLNILNKLNKNEVYEYTFECNIEYITESQLKILKKYGINRLSIGVQTFNNDLLKLINRHHTKEEVYEKISLAKRIGFNNINIDLIYALPNETLIDLKNDLDNFLKLDINHISTYALILEEHTMFSIKNIENIDEELELKMYELIKETLKNNGFNHYEISNFAKDNYESKHNLTYWNNNEYYGFGLGASAYINNKRITNTNILKDYFNHNFNPTVEEINDTLKLEYEFILGLRKTKGINKELFKNKYNKDINDIEIVNKLINEKNLIDDGINVFIPEDKIYISNDILVRFIGDDNDEK